MKKTKGTYSDTYSLGTIEIVVHPDESSDLYRFHYHAKQRDVYTQLNRESATLNAMRYVRDRLREDIQEINNFLDGGVYAEETERI